MQQLNHVLVSVDDPTELAIIARGIDIARRCGARLTVLRVTEALPLSVIDKVRQRGLDLNAVVEKEESRRLQATVDQLDTAGLEVRILVRQGTPFVAIIREVQAAGVDLVIRATEPRHGLQGRLFGSTDLQLMRKCPCPVWGLRHPEKERFRRPMVAIDVQPDDPVKTALGRHLLELAFALADAEKTPLAIVHAWRLPGESMMRSSLIDLEDSEVDTLMTELRQASVDAIEALLPTAFLERVPHTFHLVKGDAAEVIPALALKEQTDLLIMGTVCRSGLAGLVVGNTAETILDVVQCSVLTVKPVGFAAPSLPA